MSEKMADVLVAEVVMGWRDSGIKPHFGATVWATNDDASPTYAGFYPSAKIEAAWLVVEKMREKGLHLDLTEHSEGWYARFVTGATRPTANYTIEDTATMAICNAALASVSVASDTTGKGE